MLRSRIKQDKALVHYIYITYLTHHLFPVLQIPDPESFLLNPYNCTNQPPYNVNASTTYMKTKNLLYPVNVARNVARDSALTHFILPSDIELYPSPNLIPRFLNMIARNAKPLNTSTKPRVFPISIFEVDAKVQVSGFSVSLLFHLSLRNVTVCTL